MKKSNRDKLIKINKEEKRFYESFIQYGELKQAKIIFVGREEGLDGQDIESNYKGRCMWMEQIPEEIRYINGMNMDDGFYIRDCMKASWIRKNANISFEEYLKEERGRCKSNVIKEECRIMLILKHGFDIRNHKALKEKIEDYRMMSLFRPGSETAMFDYYDLPMQGKRRFVYNESEERFTIRRKNIIANVYDNYPMPMSIVYTGIQQGVFRAKSFYEEIGFQFRQLDTSMVHEEFKDIVQAAPKPKIFYIGHRRDKNQYCILTPFIGGAGKTLATRADMDVILTWIIPLIK